MNVAVIEDEDVTRESIVALLSESKFKADGFANAQEFMLAVRNGMIYRLYIVDIDLPGIRGDDMIVSMAKRRRLRDSSVLFLSGLEDKELRRAKRRTVKLFGSVSYISKPVQAETLLMQIEGLIRRV